MIIAIDGPSGTGKSTVAKKLAEELGFTHFDTGAMYRAITLHLLIEKIDLGDDLKISSFLKKFTFTIEVDAAGIKRYYSCGQDVSEAIRSQEVTALVSKVAAKPAVREALVSIQRKFAEGKDSVFEGRDIGTVVFPKAEMKIYLTARPEVRAERRYLEILAKNPTLKETKEEILKQLQERDDADTKRKTSPLRQADDAVVIDTSESSVQEVVDGIKALVEKRR